MFSGYAPDGRRLCKYHGRPILPSCLKICPKATTKCAECFRKRRCSQRAKKRRAKKWDTEFISCVFHQDRRCNRSKYIRKSERRCASCSARVKPSEGGKQMTERVKRSRRKVNYRRSMKRRLHGLGNHRTLRGIELFQRLTGFNMETLKTWQPK